MKINKLKTNPKALNTKIAVSGVALLLFCIFITILFSFASRLLPITGAVVIMTVWLFIPAMWAGSSYLAKSKFKKRYYQLTEDSLVIYRPGFVGGTKEIYRYDSMLSIKVKAGILEERSDAGSICINIPKLNQEIILKDVANPQLQVKELKKLILSHSSKSSSSIT